MDGVAASERDRLPVQGFRGTPEEIERQWYEQVYRGRGDSMRQLTWRAVSAGVVAGEEASAAFAGVHVSGGVGVDRRRELDGGCVGAVGERAGAGAPAAWAVSRVALVVLMGARRRSEGRRSALASAP
jgi:hypothetical protein